ncbi:MAG TPA: NrfD/PsrC family molybdoenzyme membrane anchor subunit [Sandaracinaceae bacterium LLY-WYZ-13_1]|nr:NrfD/PsrC family molybdoenzyme membrane anchor subunit [Sandaracinaceae bacterium LLY-WYZ-13_1]
MENAEALLLGRPSDRELTERFVTPGARAGGWLRVGLWTCAGLTGLLVLSIAYTVLTGIGTWGDRIPIGWGFAIANFVWWIGIGHAGTFISAILLLLEQPWRSSINRIAESMTLFAVVQAGLFPLLHLGRAWFFYWLVPYPSTMEVWPQFTSPLTWDVGAITTYATISLLFWYLGLIPDLAKARDTKTGRARKVFAVFAMGWRGSARHARHLKIAQLMLAGLATPLVISVHTIVSFDFAVGVTPGWHSTVFPPYFVAGAIFSGFAMTLTLVVPLRRWLGLEAVITRRHLDLLAKLTLATSLIVAYAYVVEPFLAWLSGAHFERHMYLEVRPFGPYAFLFWLTVACNVAVPQALWLRRVRHSPWVLFALSILINVGMWVERVMLVVTSQHRDFLPSSWDVYLPSWVDTSLFLGTLGFFGLLMLLTVRHLPIIPVTEIVEMKREELPDGPAEEGA